MIDKAKAVVIYKARAWFPRAKIPKHLSPRGGLKQDLGRRMVLDDKTLGSLSTRPITAVTQSRALKSKE